MTNRTISAMAIMILGVLIIMLPLYILPVCPATEVVNTSANGHEHITYKFMKCHWMARGELGVGLLVFTSGLLMLFIKSTSVRLGISLSLIFIAILVAAIPTILIGVCTNPIMPCHIGTQPALLLTSGLLFIVAVANTLYLIKKFNKKV